MRLDLLATALLLGLFAGAFFLYRRRQHFEDPYISFPFLQNLTARSIKTSFISWPLALFLTSLALFSAAFLDIHTVAWHAVDSKDPSLPHKGIAIYFVLDQSGSMREEVPVPASIDPRGKMAKIDLLKKVTPQFIEKLKNDLIGLVSFSRGAQVLAPLTLDHKVIVDDIGKIQLSHTQDTDGTALGYAIYKTASMIAATRHYAQEMVVAGEKPPYEILGSAIVVVTDGLQEPSPLDKGKRLRNMDIPEAAAFAKNEHIRLYIVNIDPGVSSAEFSPFRHIMERATALTGGQFIMASGAHSLQSVYEDIGSIEKGNITEDTQEQGGYGRAFSLYPWLVALGLISLFAAVILETILLRRVP